MPSRLIPLSAWAEANGLPLRSAQRLAPRIPGAENLAGRAWIVPEGAPVPPPFKRGRKPKAESDVQTSESAS